MEEISKRKHRVNEAIRAREVRLIDEAGRQMGILPAKEALRVAQRRGLDLVEVAPSATPPVCRLLDYGKYMYERMRRERKAKKTQKATEMKEIRLRPKTGDHDVGLKTKRIRQFIGEGSRVKVRVRFRGREITHPEIGRGLLERIAADLEDVAVVERAPRMDGRSMLMILSPISSK